jgi:hypothetical protein
VSPARLKWGLASKAFERTQAPVDLRQKHLKVCNGTAEVQEMPEVLKC